MRGRYKEFRRRTFEEWERKEQVQLRAAPVPLYGLPPAFHDHTAPPAGDRPRVDSTTLRPDAQQLLLSAIKGAP